MFPASLQRLGALVLGVLVVLLAAMAWRASAVSAARGEVHPRPGAAVDGNAAAERLSRAVQLPTIWTPADEHADAFEALHRHLESSFPAAFSVLRQERMGHHALLFTWAGHDAQAAPIALLAHQDVVPVAPGTEHDWRVPPFSGAIRDGAVWGRGAWDDKSALMAIMEAVDMLARAGFRPRETVYLAFGADEEVGGEDGAHRIAQFLKERGVKLRFVLDEGLVITHGMVPGVKRPVALIGMAEKGYLTLDLSVHGKPGHTSMPPEHSVIGMLGEAVARVESHPMPSHLSGLPEQMFEAVAPDAPLLQRLVFSNLWLTAPIVSWQMEKIPSANAMLRTTGVATMIEGGARENVMPGTATATMNFRLLPGDTSDAVERHVRDVLEGLNVEIRRRPQVIEASPVTPVDAAFDLVAHSLRELQPDVSVAPGLLIGGTDSRHFAEVAQATFRFAPVHATADDLARFHGTNERISVANYVQMIQFYERLLRNASDAGLPLE